MYRKATTILIPEKYGNDAKIMYYFDKEGRFIDMEVLENPRRPRRDSRIRALSDYIDLSMARRFGGNDKTSHQLLVELAKKILFGNRSHKMTKKRCHEFFDNPINFGFKETVNYPNGWIGEKS